MNTEFRPAVIPSELRSLAAFDRKVFSSDRFSMRQWRTYDSYWMLVNHRRIGCCAFEKHVDFTDDLRPHGPNLHRPGSLYIATTGIHPNYQGSGLGQLLKAWQISYARWHGFSRLVTNTRKRNLRMLALNKKFDFRILRTTPRYYSDPTDATVVMELILDRS